MLRIVQLLRDIRYSLWFTPTALVLAFVLLAVLAIEADARYPLDALARWPRLFGAGAEGARSMLQAVAGAMITIGALTFSITVVVLSSAANQYTSRVIRTFMGSRATQSVLGAFIGIFVYCLLVLRTIRAGESPFVPSIAITLAVALALVGVGLLVYFIHHMASSIQAPGVLARIADETADAIDSRCQRPDGAAGTPPCPPRSAARYPLTSVRTGYLRSLDLSALTALAQEQDLVIHIVRHIGDFLLEGEALGFATAPLPPHAEGDFHGAYSTADFVAVSDDPLFGLQQLADIALKALSPAVNDQRTALQCIDHVCALLLRLGERAIVHAPRCHEGRVRVVPAQRDFDVYLAESLGMVRLHGGDNPALYLHLLRALALLDRRVTQPARRRQLRREIGQVCTFACQRLAQHSLRAQIRAATAQALANTPDAGGWPWR